jgi:hypothetical protein
LAARSSGRGQEAGKLSTMAAEKQSSVSEFQKRVNAEIQDNLDEEIELVLEDDRLADLLSETERLQTHDPAQRLRMTQRFIDFVDHGADVRGHVNFLKSVNVKVDL